MKSSPELAQNLLNPLDTRALAWLRPEIIEMRTTYGDSDHLAKHILPKMLQSAIEQLEAEQQGDQ